MSDTLRPANITYAQYNTTYNGLLANDRFFRGIDLEALAAAGLWAGNSRDFKNSPQVLSDIVTYSAISVAGTMYYACLVDINVQIDSQGIIRSFF